MTDQPLATDVPSPPPRPPSPPKSPAGQEKHGQALDFPGVRFADENVTTKPQQETQVLIESLRDNRVQDERTSDVPPDEVVEVDWLGVPLARSTLPDFVSMYRQHYPGHDPRTAFVQDPRKVVRARKPKERPLYEQFEGVGWVPRDTVPEGQTGGFVKMGGEVGRALLHPQGNQWNTPTPIVDRIRKNDPMEYFNLIDPENKISVERGMYQWLVRDQAAVDERATVGPSARTSGFTANSSPHLPPAEERDFRSVYFQSYNAPPPRDDVEGLHPSLRGGGGGGAGGKGGPGGTASPLEEYPCYSGTKVMDDTPSAFLRLTPHVLRTRPDLLRRPKSHPLVQRHKEFTNF